MIRVPDPMAISFRCFIGLVFFLFRFFRLSLVCLRLRTGPRVWASPFPVGPGSEWSGGSDAPETCRGLGSSCGVGRWGLLAEPEALDGRAVALDVLPLQVVEQAAAAADHLEQAAAAVVVLGVGLEVLGQLDDAMRQDRDLHLGRTGVALMRPVLVDDLLFDFAGLRQCKLLLTCLSALIVA